MSEVHLIAALQRRPQVYDAICRTLLDSTLKPDSLTSIRELADELGGSTMPVREAAASWRRARFRCARIARSRCPA
ncbi:GntR family transcriptional regulator [Cereibacter sediminicola]|uniref:GntR family transcriptional regulator n=1 Tax=Cereibacter sediminicola TaxID=2584941 RepID=UPI001642AEA4|nr:GntR family transcriptional regulator [Cereibacter sediminicola]